MTHWEPKPSGGSGAGQARDAPRGGRGRGRARGRGRGRGKTFRIRSMEAETNPTLADQVQQHHPPSVSPYPRPSSRGSFHRNSFTHPFMRRGSGSSTPRGLPRKKSTQGGRNSTIKAGLGFHLKAPSKSLFSTSPSKPDPFFYREKTDPRLWIPVKFVNATALSDKSLLEKPQEENLNKNPAITNETSIQELPVSTELGADKESLGLKNLPILEKVQVSTSDPDSKPLTKLSKKERKKTKSNEGDENQIKSVVSSTQDKQPQEENLTTNTVITNETSIQEPVPTELRADKELSGPQNRKILEKVQVSASDPDSKPPPKLSKKERERIKSLARSTKNDEKSQEENSSSNTVITNETSVQKQPVPTEHGADKELLGPKNLQILEKVQVSTLDPDSKPPKLSKKERKKIKSLARSNKGDVNQIKSVVSSTKRDENPIKSLARSTKDDETQIAHFTEASIGHWQAQFPGLFSPASSFNAFPNRAPNVQQNHITVPLQSCQELGQSKTITPALPSREPQEEPAFNLTRQSTSTGFVSTSSRAHTGRFKIWPEDFTGSSPAATTSNFQEAPDVQMKQTLTEMLTSDSGNSHATEESNIETPKPIDLSDVEMTAVKSNPTPGPLFFVDDEGDPNNVPSFSSARPTALGQVLSNNPDAEDGKISIQLSHFPPPDSQFNSLHLFRTITDEPKVESRISESYQQPFTANLKPAKLPKSKTAKWFRHSQKKKERRKLARHEQSFTHRPDCDSGSDIDLGDEIQEVTNVASTSAKVQPPKISHKAQKRAMKEKEEKELLEDYIKHTMMSEDEGSDDPAVDTPNHDQSLMGKMQNDVFLRTFIRGMDSETNYHITIDELDQQLQEEKDDAFFEDGGWQTENSTNSLENELEALGLEVSKSDHESIESESSQEYFSSHEILEISSDCDTDDESDISLVSISKGHGNLSRKMHKGKSNASFEKKWKEKFTEGSSDADIQKVLETFEMKLDSSSESSDDDFEEELPTLTKVIFVPKKNRKSKKRAGYSNTDNDSELIEFIDELQAQWRKDRSRKAEKKKARAEARLLSDPQTKKQRKKSQKRDVRNGNNHQEPDLIYLDKIIKDFITFRPDETSLSLPSLTKKTRARVHELATLYGMTSRSLGTGRHRYPVLNRTHRTDIYTINKQKHRRIVYGGTGEAHDRSLEMINGGKEKYLLKHRSLKKNREGEIVGEGVEHIGEENVGFMLLTKMGWSLGQTMGHPDNSASALQVPLLAVMKSSKAGLGSTSHLQR